MHNDFLVIASLRQISSQMMIIIIIIGMYFKRHNN